MTGRCVPALAAVVASFLTFAAIAGPEPADEGDVRAARVYLSTLRPALRREVLLSFADGDRQNWHYVPRRRRGVTLKEMNEPERRAAHALLRSALSSRGYEKATGVIELEGILREIETFGWFRDPGLYTLTIFGEPSETSPWGWRFEGHHLSLNFSSVGRDLVSSTPSFFGANPARVPSGPRAGWRVLSKEEDLARDLLSSLTAAQRARAIVSATAPADIVMSPGRRNPPPAEGLPVSDMTSAQRAALLGLVAEYLGNVRAGVADERRKEIEAAGVEKIRFAWAGATDRGRGHYYRIQGPTFAIEYDNTQNGANHVHSVWRDLRHDFGADLLRRHYEESPHHADARGRVRE
jgi:hypothetical protein